MCVSINVCHLKEFILHLSLLLRSMPRVWKFLKVFLFSPMSCYDENEKRRGKMIFTERVKLIRYRRIYRKRERSYHGFLYHRRHDRISETEIVMIERMGGIRSNMSELIDELILMRVPIPLDININNGGRIFGNARSSVAHAYSRRINDRSIEFIPPPPPLYHYSYPRISTLFHPLIADNHIYTFTR